MTSLLQSEIYLNYQPSHKLVIGLLLSADHHPWSDLLSVSHMLGI